MINPAPKTRKTLAAALVLAIFTLCLLLAAVPTPDPMSPEASPSPTATAPGRYRLTTAKIDTDPTLFRIDTATGRAWQLIGVPATIGGNAGHINGWQPVSENPWETVKAMTALIPKPANPGTGPGPWNNYYGFNVQPNKTASNAPHSNASP